VKQECGVCGKEIETGGMGAAPMCEHYKHKHPTEFYGSYEDIPPEYKKYAGAWSNHTHPNPGEQAALDEYA